jgi:hypothetical protein
MIPAAYRTVLGSPYVTRALVTALAGRIGAPMAGLAVTLYVVDRTGSFAAAGLVSATWVGAAGVGGMLSSRLIDRGNPRAVLLITAAGSAAGTVVLASAGTSSVPALVALTAGAAVFWPPLVPASRALWPVLLPDEDARSTMYSLEASLQELTFIVGPMLAGLTAAAASPGLGVALAGFISLAGVAAFVTTPGVQRLAGRDAPPARVRDLAALAPLFGAGALLVCGLSIVEVAVVAVATAAGAPAAAGLLLAVWSAGSLAGGVVFAALPARGGAQGRLFGLLCGVALMTSLLAPVSHLMLLGALLVAGGVLIAPALAAIYGLVQQRAPAGAVTQTFAAMTMSLLAGAAAGAAAGGVLSQAAGPAVAFLVAAGTPVLAAAVVAPGAARGRADRVAAAGSPVPTEA